MPHKAYYLQQCVIQGRAWGPVHASMTPLDRRSLLCRRSAAGAPWLADARSSAVLTELTSVQGAAWLPEQTREAFQSLNAMHSRRDTTRCKPWKGESVALSGRCAIQKPPIALLPAWDALPPWSSPRQRCSGSPGSCCPILIRLSWITCFALRLRLEELRLRHLVNAMLGYAHRVLSLETLLSAPPLIDEPNIFFFLVRFTSGSLSSGCYIFRAKSSVLILGAAIRQALSRLPSGTNHIRYISSAAAMSGFYSDIKASSGTYKFYGNGEWKESTSGKSVSILNPTSNEAVYQVQGRSLPIVCTVFSFHGAMHLGSCTAACKECHSIMHVRAVMPFRRGGILTISNAHTMHARYAILLFFYHSI